MIQKPFHTSLIATLLSTAIALAACTSSAPRPHPVATETQTRISNTIHPALKGTIGEFATLIDSSPIRVEGYGIVAGLPNTGAKGDMDSRVRDLLLNRLLITGVGMYSTNTQDISPEAILGSSQVAAVEVRGLIPPLARKGTTFDLYINALPGSGATSLSTGLLWPADLKQIGLNLDSNSTRTIAMGRGPIFIPAPLEAAAAVAAGKKPYDVPKALLNGRVIAGGVCAEDREARLQVYIPDPMRTRFIERAINNRFSGREKAATAENENFVNLHIPQEYADNPMDFVDLVKHLYIGTNEPGFVQDRAKELIAALQDPTSPKRELGLALQGLGTSIIPDFLEPNYTSANQEVRFWCARAGACMQHVPGMVTLQEIVKDPSNPFRRQALVAMIEASRGRDTQRATLALYDMISSFNTDDRILAYHAMLAIRSKAVASYSVGRKFIVDVIEADSPPLIYVLESDSPRIAFIGRHLELAPGALYMSKDKLLTVMADDAPEAANAGRAANAMPVITAASVAGATAATPPEKESVKLYWRSPLGDKTVLLRAGANLPSIVARATWIPAPDPNHPFDPQTQYIGASYQRMSEMLAEMVADKVIDASFVVQKSPDQVMSPTDLALSGRPDTAARVTPPAPPPAAANLPEAGAPSAPPLQP